MHVQIDLTPESQAKLQERAAAAGQDLESFIALAVEEKLWGDVETTAILPPDQWLAEFDAWIRSHSSRNPNVDDSRESIYSDRI
ncbi:MAG: hypothetical protein WD894_04795 [Pirellulales bacterium]